MNSRWKWNSIIFAMTLVSTRFGGRIKIRDFGALKSQSQVKLSQTWSKLTNISKWLRFDVKTWKMLSSNDFDQLWLLVKLDWLGAFWSFWLEMALWVLRCPNWLCHVNLDVSVAQWRKVNIFGIFGVWHCPFFIGQNIVSIAALSLSGILIGMKGVG